MNSIKTLISLVLILFAVPVWAQDYIAGVVGGLSGTVEDDQGNMVAPQAAISATMMAQLAGSGVTADISGTGSCTGGLGLHFEFEAQFDAATNSFTGMYSDIPGTAPYKTLEFISNGGTSWSAVLSGTAPSPSGERAYDLSYDFEVPESAIFAASQLPDDLVYGGSLNTTQTVSVPVNVQAAGIDETVDIEIDFSGSWDATAVPQVDQSVVFTGSASGSFVSTNSPTVTATVPVLGSISIPINVDGSFGGSLFLVDESTVAFQGSWVANAADQSFGGDINITINTEDTSSFPFSISGTLPFETGVSQLPLIEIPFSVAGSFPLDLNLP